MSARPGPRSGSLNETIAPSAATRPGCSDDTIAPIKAKADPAATIAPVAAADPAATVAPAAVTKPPLAETVPPAQWVASEPKETIAPAGAAGVSLATIDFSVQSPGLGATIDSIPSLSSASRGGSTVPRPEVEGYTILSELGRGGMGVVYKARQKKLNRIVALKMVLAGAHAGQDQLARFFTEAEAVAHLQQPNIVQIYEVGEHNGLPYFSLEFVDGGCLADRIDGKPQPVKDAAQMVERLARAIGYAHQQGIIHRDLKPANVLLTKEGEPKITDFGLAKRLESDSSQTKSGTLMGTPNYMAPEQARGLVKEIGPLADVYALGVILYEMLTGRTPFLGTSILDTLQQVRNLDPVPPSRLQPKIPRDVETICLKCLEKAPAKRYESATALAEDLHRFIAGEPILARPVGPHERLWRWCQRNQRVAALSAAVLLLLVSMAIGGPVAAILISQQKAIAVENEKAAKAAQALAETNEKLADANARAAEEQSEIAFGAFRTFVSSVSKLRDTPATQGIKQQLLRGGIEGLQTVMKTPKNTSRSDAIMADAYQQMGDIFQSLGQNQDARQQYEVSYKIRHTLAQAASGQFEPQRELAAAVGKLGDISLLEGNTDAARRHYAEALKIREQIAAQHDQNDQAQIDLATSFVTLGNVSEPHQATKYYQEALRLRQALAATAPRPSRASRKRDVWIISNRLADLAEKQNDLPAALNHYEQALAQATELDKLVSNSMRARLDLAMSHVHVGNVQARQGDAQAAKASYGRALEILRPLAAEDARDIELNTLLPLVLARHGDHAEAAAKADALRKLAERNFRTHYNAACCYALCSAAASASESDSQLAGGYAARAIAALKQAIALGFNDFDAMKQDHDLAAISSHPGFLALLPAGN
jgi:serine/threonine-protein kinase